MENKDITQPEENISILKPKVWKLFNWMIFCSFIIVFLAYINAISFVIGVIFIIFVALFIKLVLVNKLPPIDFKIYLIVFVIVLIVCEYNHLQVVYYKTFKIGRLDYDSIIVDPGIFVAALSNIVFTTKTQVAPDLFFREDFIQWVATKLNKSPEKALLTIHATFFMIIGYLVPLIINIFYSMLCGIIAVRIKQIVRRD